MRKVQILLLLVTGMLALSMITLADGNVGDVEAIQPLSGGRMVFVEDITAVWCGYCPAASKGLLELSHERSDFRFITLIDDRVPDAAARNEEFNPSGFPTVMFDGGYEEVVGAQSSNSPYDAAVDSCISRDTPSIDVDVTCIDQGSSRLRIDVEVTNNEAEDYSGRLLINIVEIESRYLDADGNNYPYSLLGYAADEMITIGSGRTYSTSATWIGADNEDMKGNDFSDIDPDNIVVYASVINGDSNYKVRTGIPPSYFTAYYIDNVGEAFPVNLEGAPEVKINSPRSGRTVSGEVEIVAEVTSETDIDIVEVKIGQEDWKEMTQDGSEYIYTWDTTTYNNVPVKISVKATDRYDLAGTSFIEVIVENEGVHTPPEILEISHSPVVVYGGDEVAIEVEILEYDTHITKVELAYCIGELCYLPQEMLSIGSRYELVIGPFDDGDEVKYNVIVSDDEGNEITSSDQRFTAQAQEPTDDDDTDDDPGTTPSQTPVDDTPSPFFLMVPAAVIFVVLMYRRKR